MMIKEQMLNGCRIAAEILLSHGFWGAGQKIEAKSRVIVAIKKGADSPSFLLQMILFKKK